MLVDSPGEARAEGVSCVVSGPWQRRGAGAASHLTGMLRVSVARFSGADRVIRLTISPEEGRRRVQRSAAACRSSRKGGQGARAGRGMSILRSSKILCLTFAMAPIPDPAGDPAAHELCWCLSEEARSIGRAASLLVWCEAVARGRGRELIAREQPYNRGRQGQRCCRNRGVCVTCVGWVVAA